MKLDRLFTLLLTLAVTCGTARPAAAAGFVPLSDDVKAVAAGNNAFALDLYAKLAKDNPTGNLVFSPYSISSALAMTYAGARGETADQMRKALHFTMPDERVYAAYAELNHKLMAAPVSHGEPEWELSVANALWAQSGYRYNPVFLHLLNASFDSDMHQADFATATEKARSDINDWINDKTRGKIPVAIPPRVLDSDTVFVLVNALYLKARWQYPFQPRNTTYQPFHVGAADDVAASFMNEQKEAEAIEDENLQVLELTYFGGRLAMDIFLPRKIDGLAALEDSLAVDRLNQWTGQLREYQTEVYLPKFKLVAQSKMGPMLAAMNMTNAFNARRADFSGITTDKKLYIAQVIHSVFLNVNEEGTEAAAATAVVGGFGGRGGSGRMVFRADHPFIFLVREAESGAILFMGRVANPAN